MKPLSPVDYAIISQAFVSIAQECGTKLIRSACSTIVREAKDCAAAILDRDGYVVAQSELMPIQLGSIGPTARACLDLFPPETLKPGDFLINNDPYSGGQHLNDVFIYVPVFFQTQLIGLVGTVAHHIDLGGAKAGIAVGATDVYQEGLVIPPSRYNLEDDWHGGPFERFLRANIRVPDQTIGDFNAQFAACGVGVGRICDLALKHGKDKVTSAMSELMDYSERRVRNAITLLPDGVYEGEDWVDDDGISEEPLLIKVTVTVAQDQIDVDFSGTCAQAVRNINAPLASTVSAALCCLKPILTTAEVPFNAGATRAISVSAPKGSLLNPSHPAPVRARMEPSYRVYGAVMRALAKVAPERAIASGFDTTYATALSQLGENGFSVLMELIAGGFGASSTGDGCDGIAGPLSNSSNTPIEIIDMEYPFLLPIEYSLRENSAGVGQFRGGTGQVRAYEVLDDDVMFAMYTDRMRIAPKGLAGGGEGACARAYIRRAGQTIELASKVSMDLRRGDVIVFESGGGAGFGDAALRSTESIETDRLDGLVNNQVPDR